MVEVVSVVIALATTAFIGYPFYMKKQKQVKFDLNNRIVELEARKNEVYTAIKDIEFDYQMGKLSEEDYNELRENYKEEAAKLLSRMDQVAGGSKKKKDAPKAAKFCHQCGAEVEASDKFCTSCGTALK